MPMDITRKPFFLLLLFLLMAGLSWFDVISSNQAGLVDANRTVVHYFIAVALVFHLYGWLRNNRSRINIRPVSFLLLAILVWTIIVDWINDIPLSNSGAMLLMAIWWYATYQFGYCICARNSSIIRPFVFVYLLLFIIWVLLNLYSRQQIIINFERNHAVTGFAYHLLVFLPFILLIEKKRVLKWCLLVLCILMVLTSYKRGTIITLPVMLLVFGYSKGRIEGNIFPFFIIAISIVLTFVFIIPLINQVSGGFLAERFSQEQLREGSGRADNWALAIDVIRNRDFFSLLVGSGHRSSVDLIGTGIHNEWIEFLYCFGFVGLVLFILLGIQFLRRGLFFLRKRCKFAPQMLMMTSYFFMVSIFSGFYGAYVSYYFFLFMGLIEFLNEEDSSNRVPNLI